MIRTIFDRVWHDWFGRPYYLARRVDVGEGQPIVLLHGIGQNGHIWQHVIKQLREHPWRVVAFDLLGFGDSPKPDWKQYTVDDHASAVIASLERARLKHKIVLVGHSMGCLVAVRVARLRPDLIQHLVLYEMPLYEGLPEKRLYRIRRNWYYRLYKWVLQYEPGFDEASIRLAQRLARRITGFEVNQATWQPFIKSLEHTIMHQTAADDIKQLKMPMDVIYGSFDMLVIRGEPKAFFGEESDHIKAYNLRVGHVISRKASQFIVSRVQAALR